MRMHLFPSTISTGLLLAALLSCSPAQAGVPNRLEMEQGRSETRVLSAPYRIRPGRSVADIELPERLSIRQYDRVHSRPENPGEFFYGDEVFWIYRREHRTGGVGYPPSLIGLALDGERGTILGLRDLQGRVTPFPAPDGPWLEPVLLSESLAGDRAPRRLVDLDKIPEHVWRPLLAIEDSRFFQHGGLDSRAIARAARANVKEKGIAQGGSTLTQQLIKNRDLTPKQSLGRKVSEAFRALMLEATYSKREILQAYLNQVYLGHMDGVAVHGYGAGAQAFFSKKAEELTLGEAALLAAIIQGPNRLHPVRHPERARERRDLVLARMESEGWAESGAVKAARKGSLGLKPAGVAAQGPRYFLSFAAAVTVERTGSRIEGGRGLRVETTLDALLQRRAEQAVVEGLERLKSDNRRLRGGGLSAALVALHAETGEVLAYVGGDPSSTTDRFDRARNGRRQPGSAVKPFVLLEALEECGDQRPLTLSTRVADQPLVIDLPDGTWEPENYDRAFKGNINVRTAMAESRNVPLVRIARRCGMEAVAARFRKAGLPVPEPAPPSFVLGSVETTPLELARAYTVLATPGRILEPLAIRRIEQPGGGPLVDVRRKSSRVVRPASAWLVQNTLRTAVESGTAHSGALGDLPVAAKTGSSSKLRDAWFAGTAGPVVTVVWVGRDGDEPLGASGSRAAGPIWQSFMEAAVAAYPYKEQDPPVNIVERYVDRQTGLLVRERNPRAVLEYFRRSVLPPRDRFFRRDQPVPTVR